MADTEIRKIQVQGVHHITLNGADRQTSIDFWEGVLGMPFIFDQPNLDDPNQGHLYFDPGDGRLITIFTNEERAPDPSNVPEAVGSLHHLAFNVSQASFWQIAERLDARGVSHTGPGRRGRRRSRNTARPARSPCRPVAQVFDHRPICWMMLGWMPSVGSSSSSSFGRVISARAMASCCCWPPDRSPPRRSSISLRTGNSSKISSGTCGRLRQAGKAGLQVLAHRQQRKDVAPLRHVADARAPAHGRQGRRVCPSSVMVPPERGCVPEIAFIRRSCRPRWCPSRRSPRPCAPQVDPVEDLAVPP
jgi:catechol 2,3-dioxygenase-like lactoylglutathione lyase family enzyme